MSRFWLFILACGLLFSGFATMLAPRILAWYAEPPIEIGVTCNPAIEWGTRTLINLQLGGLIFGAILGGFLFFWIRGLRTPRPASAAPPPTETRNP